MVSLMKLFRIVEVIITLNGLFTYYILFKASSPRGEGEIENYNINYYILYSVLN